MTDPLYQRDAYLAVFDASSRAKPGQCWASAQERPVAIDTSRGTRSW